MLETNRHSGKLSGKGRDRGIGHNADVLLGLWSCCRNVDPSMQGCIHAPTHTRTLLKCRQCGSFYNHLDNTGAKLRGAPNCRYHRKEPEPAQSHGNAVWPCCGTVGYEVRGSTLSIGAACLSTVIGSDGNREGGRANVCGPERAELQVPFAVAWEPPHIQWTGGRGVALGMHQG